MSVDMQVFQGFAEQMKHLGEHAQAVEMTDAERLRKAKAVFREKLDTVSAMDLESCVHCGMCAEACHYYLGTKDPKYVPIRKLDLIRRFYRRELSPMRWLYRLLIRDITADDLRQWQELVYDSCTECARCSTICPMGINIAEMVNINRQALAAAGLIPDDLLAVAQEQCNYGTVFGAGPDQLRTIVEELRAEGLEVPLDKEKADVMVLTSTVDLQLFKDAMRATVKIMDHLDVDWTFRSCAFEGANFGLLSGNEDLEKIAAESVIKQALDCGAKSVILPECGHAYPALRWDGPNVHGERFPFEIYAISEFIGKQVMEGRLKLRPLQDGHSYTYHDPCKLGRHGGIFAEPRAVLEALGVDLRESETGQVYNWCCGGGAGVFVIGRAAPLRQAAFEIKMKQVEATGADTVVTSCGSCRLNFLAGAMQANWNREIASLVELVGNNLAEEPSNE